MLTIQVEDRSVLAALTELSRRTADLEPALREMGEELQDSTMRRFETSTGPDGQRWEPNSPTTILEYLSGRGGAYSETTGRLTAKGVQAAMSKRPLIGNTRNLSGTITYQVVDGGQTLLVGSPQKYAAVQQFGAKAREFGRAPWGDIPARPFLGVSDEDQTTILDILGHYLAPGA